MNDTVELDIDSLLGSMPKKSEPVVKPDKPDTGVTDLVRRLASWTDGCRDVPVDLRLVSFVSDDGGMWLAMPDGSPIKRLDFKRDPSNPKDAKILHAQKQFCRMLGIPHAFLVSNRPSMRESLVRTWQSGLETEDKKAKCVARIREGGSVAMIRALLPERAVPPKACDIVKAAWDTFGGAVRLVFAHGDDRDDLVLHARFVFQDKLTVDGIDLQMGFDLVFSELGAQSMTVDAIVHDPANMVSYVASYGGEPFFSSKYEGLQAKEVAEMFPSLLTRIRAEASEMATAVKTAISDGIYSARQDCVHITRAKGFTSAMRKAVFHEVTQATDIVSKMDLARHVASVAKDFDSLKALVVERAAGRYINLCFARALPDGDKETADAGEAQDAAQVC